MKKAQNEFIKRATKVLAQRRDSAEEKISLLRGIEPVKGECWSKDPESDLDLTIMFQETFDKLSNLIRKEASFGFFSMGEKLIIVESFLQQYRCSFPEYHEIYKKESRGKIFLKLKKVFEVLEIPTVVLEKIW